MAYLFINWRNWGSSSWMGQSFYRTNKIIPDEIFV